MADSVKNQGVVGCVFGLERQGVVVLLETQTTPLSFSLTSVLEFDVQVTAHRDTFLTIKPTRCTNFSNLFLE